MFIRLPEILQENLTDGIDGLCLMSDSGSILSSAVIKLSVVNETKLAAISSSLWANLAEGIDIDTSHKIVIEFYRLRFAFPPDKI